MAYLRLKNFAKCIEDADKTIELEPDYVKAYHRRGKAYLSTNKFELAIRDFQFILEKNPDDKDINASLKQAREKLKTKEERLTPKTMEIIEEVDTPGVKATSSKPEPVAQPAKKGAFKRVNIVEEDDSEEETPKDTASSEDKENSSAKENKPLIQEVSSTEEQSKDWWQKKNSNYEKFTSKKGETEEKENELKQTKDTASELAAQIAALEEQKRQLMTDAVKREKDAKIAAEEFSKKQAELHKQEALLKSVGRKVDEAVEDLATDKDAQREINKAVYEDL